MMALPGVASSHVGGGGSNSLNDISSLIRLKERELHEMQGHKQTQLEKMIEERDNVLMEAQNRFEQLKEDFRYNLTLLEARDLEIARLESSLTRRDKEFADCDGERRSLIQRVEQLELRDTDRAERSKQDQVNSRRILQELKDVIESMRWAAAEETKAKQREVEALKDELVRLGHSREEILESQRRDLTRTFEQLLQQREESFVLREREIGASMLTLDSKFEQLTTENSRLKADLAECQRRVEHTTEELALKEESCRHLQWVVDDERSGRQQADDSLQRRLQQATLELTSNKDAFSKELADVQAKLAQARSDTVREKDFRVLVEQRMEESRGSLQQSVAHLEAELLDARAREMTQRGEIDRARKERESALERCQVVRLEADSASTRAMTLERDCAAYRTEAAEAKAGLVTLQKRLSELEESSSSLQSLHSSDLNEHTARVRAEVKAAAEQEYSSLLAKARSEFDAEKASLEDAAAEAASEAQRLKSQLHEEREEAAALRLRMRLHTDRGAALRSSLSHTEGDTRGGAERNLDRDHDWEARDSRTPRGLAPPSISIPPIIPQMRDPREPLRRSSEYAASPVFSEDFGPVSLPGSPDGPAQRPYAGGFRLEHESLRDGLGDSQESQRLEGSQQRQSDSGSFGSKLADENERLKRVVREMRADIEALQAQVVGSTSNPSVSDTGASHQQQQLQHQLQQQLQHYQHLHQQHSEQVQQYQHQVSDLEGRLEAAMSEVTRLRQERRMLLDASNELRAELNRAGRPNTAAPISSLGSSGSGAPSSSSVTRMAQYAQLPLPPPPQQYYQHQHQHQQYGLPPMPSQGYSHPPQQQLQQQQQPYTWPEEAANPRPESRPDPRTDRGQRVKAWTDKDFNPAPGPDPSGQLGELVGQGIAAQPSSSSGSGGVRGGFGSATSTNSARTTPSQLRARQRLSGLSGPSGSGSGPGGIAAAAAAASNGAASGGPRRVMNYSQGLRGADGSSSEG